MKNINFENQNIKVEFKERFNLVCIDNFIDEKLFIELRNNYPSDQCFNVKTKFAWTLNDNNIKFNEFLNDKLIWSKLFNEINSYNFKKKIIEIFKIKNVYFSEKSWKKYIPSLFKEVKFEITFNKSKNRSFNDPHTDATRKIVSMVIFFTNENWAEHKGGIVRLFKPRNKQDENNWRNLIIKENDLIKIKEIFPKPNRFYGFKKTKNSYHSVSEVKCNEDESRDVLMINLSYSKKKDIPYLDVPIFKKILNKFKLIFSVN